MPEAQINVFDNNSKDNSVKLAKEAGAIVTEVNYQGKGKVIQRAFSDISNTYNMFYNIVGFVFFYRINNE